MSDSQDRRRRWTLSARVVVVGLVLSTSGCSRTEPEQHAARTPHPTEVSASATAESAAVRGEGCRQGEHSMVSRLEWPLVLASNRVSADPSGRSAFAARALADRVDALWRRLVLRCARPSAKARVFAARVRRGVEGPLDGPGLDAVLGSYRDWATSADERRRGEALVKDRGTCVALIPQVRASYAVWWEPTSRGKDYWVQLIVQNHTGRAWGVALRGSLWATDPLPGWGRASTLHRGRHSLRFVWGGSSADEMIARPHGRSTTFVGVGEYDKIHLGPDGSVFDVRPQMSFGWAGCAVPVYRDH